MNFLDSFNDFYNNLSSDGLFFFWIVIFLLVVLVFLSIVLITKNNKLAKLLVSEKRTKENIIKEEKEETIPVKTEIEENIQVDEEKIEEEKKIEIENKIEEVEQPKTEIKEDVKESRMEVKEDVKDSGKGLYQKNVLREMNARMQTSPINIEREREEKLADGDEFDLSGIDMGENFVSPLESMEDLYETNDNMSFVEDISRKLEEEQEPSNIELTDYEKKQEEEAIISYEELQKVKDKIYNITEDEENDDFIDELKSFRLDLQ